MKKETMGIIIAVMAFYLLNFIFGFMHLEKEIYLKLKSEKTGFSLQIEEFKEAQAKENEKSTKLIDTLRTGFQNHYHEGLKRKVVIP